MLMSMLILITDDDISLPGWMEEDERLAGKLGHHGTFTTGRADRRPQQSSKKTAEFSPRSQESVVPGKLNMADYHHVTSALSRLNMKQRQAPLADDEELGGDDGGGYAVPQDVINNGLPGSEYAQPMVALQEQHSRAAAKPRSKNRERRERAKLDYSDSETDSSSEEPERPSKKSGATRKARKKRSAIPVATPVVPNIPIKLPETASLEKRKLPCQSVLPSVSSVRKLLKELQNHRLSAMRSLEGPSSFDDFLGFQSEPLLCFVKMK